MSKSTGGGLNVIRDALQSRKGNLAVLAKDVGISASAMDSFARGDRATLPIEIIDAVVAEIWHGWVIYLPEQDLLSSVEPPPARVLGTPPPYQKIDIPPFTPGPLQRGGPQLEQPKPKRRPRAGRGEYLGVMG